MRYSADMVRAVDEFADLRVMINAGGARRKERAYLHHGEIPVIFDRFLQVDKGNGDHPVCSACKTRHYNEEEVYRAPAEDSDRRGISSIQLN